MIRQPIDPYHQVPIISSIPNFNPQALSLFLTISQRELLTVYLLFNVKCNSPTLPPSPVPSKNAIPLYSGIPVMGVVSPRFCNSNQIINFQAYHSFQLLLLIFHATCISAKALQLGFLIQHLSGKAFPQTFRRNLKFSPTAS